MLAARNGDGRFDVTVAEHRWPRQMAAVLVVGEQTSIRPSSRRQAVPDQEPRQLRTEDPLDADSAEYAAEFNEVKALGSAIQCVADS